MTSNRRLRLFFFALSTLLDTADLGLAAEKHSDPVLPGGNSKEPINIDAAKLDYFDKEQKLVYTGNVTATQGTAHMKATSLVIFLRPKDPGAESGPPSSNEVRRIEAAGPVTIVSKDQVGTGDSGLYEKAENKVYLIGNVTLSQGPNVTKGDKIIYDLDTNQAVVLGHVRSMFIPNSSTSAAKPEESGSKKPARGGVSSEFSAKPSTAAKSP